MLSVYCISYRSCYVILFIFCTDILPVKMTSFPDSLEGFGYAFNKDGCLCKLDPVSKQLTNQGFDFNVRDNISYNQKHYEALGDVITQHVYQLLETNAGLMRLAVPEGGTPDRSTFVFATEDLMTNEDKMMILIHGSGVVRAGQWARSMIINDSLQSGTQLPYIEQAKLQGYSVLVMNSNDNSRLVDGHRVDIKGSESPEKHVDYVWRTYVRKSPAKHIAVVAHSYGGVCTLHLACEHESDFRARVFAVAMTDSVHSDRSLPEKVNTLLRDTGCNWVASNEPLDTDVSSRAHTTGIKRVSAGHVKHEMTSWSSFPSVFRFIQQRYAAVSGKQEL